MFRWMWVRLRTRYEWLRPEHPVAYRDAHWMQRDLPRFLRRLTNPWTMLGYAAVLHGALFLVSIISYQQITPALSAALLPILSPFLTPFGTPIAAGMLHSVLYWALLIGITSQMTYSIAHEFETGTWRLLRLTPYSPSSILLAKATVVARNWTGVLRTLTLIRLAATLVIPVAVASQRTREATALTGLDLLGIALFLAQPFAEAFLAVGLGMLVASVVHTTMWARVYALGVLALVAGGLNALASFWMIFTSPIGPLAGLLVPLGHWTPLVAAAVPPTSPDVYAIQLGLLSLVTVLLPVVIGVLAIRLAIRRISAAV